jgi:hypothetical protein
MLDTQLTCRIQRRLSRRYRSIPELNDGGAAFPYSRELTN